MAPGRARRGLALATLAACISAAAAPAGIADGTPRPGRPRCAEPFSRAETPPLVEVDLELSSDSIVVGEPLRLKLTVRNHGVTPVPYSHGGQTHDFWIRDERGTIWLWSQGKVFTDILVRTYLWPGETKTARTRWVSRCTPDGRDLRPGLPGPGRYVAQGLWVSNVEDPEDRAWWSDEVSFTIRPR